MSTQVQYRRGTATQNNAFTGALAEITVDTTNQILRVHDGVTAGGYSLVGLTASQTLTNKIYQGTSVSVTGNVAGGNVTTAGIVSATGNITGGNLSGTSIVGTLTTAAQTNITSVGTLGSLSVTGNITGGNLLTSGNIVDTGAFSIITGASGNVNLAPNGTNVLVTTTTGANITGTLNATGNANVGNLGAATVVATTLTGTLSTAAQPNITSVGTLTSVSVSGNITAGNLSGTSIVGTLTTAAQTNITSVGTLTALSVGTGNITGGNLILSGAIIDSAQLDIQTSAANANIVFTPNGTGNVNIGRMSASGNITAVTFIGALSGAATSATTAGTVTTAAQPNITSVGTLTSVSITGNVTAGNLSGTSIVGTLTTAAQTNITSVGTLTALSVTGNVTGGNLITAGLVSLSSITKTGSNGVGNIGAAASAFNTVFAKATSAQYADVAEQYQADADYPPGTVLILGGTQEVTASTHSHDSAVAGVVSQKPSYLMNAGLQTANSVPVALLGRVPCQVIGTITRGQLLVTSDIPGTAIALDHNRYVPGCVIGKALENYNSNVPGTIEIAVGSK